METKFVVLCFCSGSWDNATAQGPEVLFMPGARSHIHVYVCVYIYIYISTCFSHSSVEVVIFSPRMCRVNV